MLSEFPHCNVMYIKVMTRLYSPIVSTRIMMIINPWILDDKHAHAVIGIII